MSFTEKNGECISKEQWLDRLSQFYVKQSDVNRLIMNYLITEGFKEAAEKFQVSSLD